MIHAYIIGVLKRNQVEGELDDVGDKEEQEGDGDKGKKESDDDEEGDVDGDWLA